MDQQGSSRRGLFALSAGASVASAIPNNGAPAADAASAQPRPLPREEVRPGVILAYADDWFGPPWQSGAPILLLHGVAEACVAWQQWVPVLSPSFRLFRPDLPGFGQSPLPTGYDCSTKLIAGDIVRLMDALKVDRFHLVGAKIGGSTAMQLAADYPDRVRTLAVFGSPAKGSPGGKADLNSFADWIRRDGVRGWARATMPSRLGSQASPAMLSWWADELMGQSSTEACLAYTSAVTGLNLEPILGKITAPTLVVTTESSPLQPVAAARMYQTLIPQSKLLVLPGDSYHIAAVQPEMCAQKVVEFIASA
jgi:3-oxoadipate enol-lactonase